MTGTIIRRSWGTVWRPDYRTQRTIDTSTTVQAMINALAVQCPECERVMGEACTIPAGLEHQGLFVHHERIAAGDRA